MALAGAMENRELKYFEYVTTYRSPAATGCGMGFAYWHMIEFRVSVEFRIDEV